MLELHNLLGLIHTSDQLLALHYGQNFLKQFTLHARHAGRSRIVVGGAVTAEGTGEGLGWARGRGMTRGRHGEVTGSGGGG